MTTSSQATQAVYAHVRGLWTATRYTFDAERFEPVRGEPWIRVSVRELASLDPSHGPRGGRRVQRRASVIAQAFAPVSVTDGVGAALTLAEAFRDLFEGRDIMATDGALTFGAASLRRIGVDGAWYQVNVDCPFAFDATI